MHQGTNSGLPLIRNGLVGSQEKREVGMMNQRAEETSGRKGELVLLLMRRERKDGVGMGRARESRGKRSRGKTDLGWSALSHPCSQLVSASICPETCPLPLCAHPREAERDLSSMISEAPCAHLSPRLSCELCLYFLICHIP